MLPESRLCGRMSEQMRRLLKARSMLVRVEVGIKNQIHALLTAEGMEDKKASLQSKRGRRKVPDTLKERENGLVAQPSAAISSRSFGHAGQSGGRLFN
jgi:flagellar biosynthesis chaperone FliJ